MPRGDALIRHALAVEACMRAYARKDGEDEETRGIVGMLHDFDWDGRTTPSMRPGSCATVDTLKQS